MLCVLFLFCASVIQGHDAYVTNNSKEVTRFPLTASITFLAHNTLVGKHFSQISEGDLIIYLDDDTTTKALYVVTEIVEGQASDPNSLETNVLIDGMWMTPKQVWSRVGYLDPTKLVLQTCIEKDGDLNWGRLFVIAEHNRVELSP